MPRFRPFEAPLRLVTFESFDFQGFQGEDEASSSTKTQELASNR